MSTTIMTAANVAKKFQCFPYSFTGTCVPAAPVLHARSAASATSGPIRLASRRAARTGPMSAKKSFAARPPLLRLTNALANMNDPAPTSIRPTPVVSVLPNRRGKAGKSTARIATAVASVMEAR
jgi:hypothetical protein